MSDESAVPKAAAPSIGSNGKSSSVLSNRAIVISAALVVLLAAGAAWLLLAQFGAGTEADKARLDAIRTVGTIVLGAGGAIALLLAARRQQTAERDLAQKERVQLHTEDDATERRITELYAKAGDQLGSDKAPVRLTGLYALERLAQNNPTYRQTIVNILCAYLRMPYTPPVTKPAEDSGQDVVNNYMERVQEREVRLTAQRLLTDHLAPGDGGVAAPVITYWADISLDLTNATLINFSLANCAGAAASFESATFVGRADFQSATFTGRVSFNLATFTDQARFVSVTFVDSASFRSATFTSPANFQAATFTGGATFFSVTFTDLAFFHSATFTGRVSFQTATFTGRVNFFAATFADQASFDFAKFTGHTNFVSATFADQASFELAKFTGQTSFNSVKFNRSTPHEVEPFMSPTSGGGAADGLGASEGSAGP